MSYDDFCICTFDEFESICKSWRVMTENNQKSDWERMRLLATICIQPHVKKKITPRQLLPLPWDDIEKSVRNKAPERSSEDRMRRFEKVVKRLGR